MTVDWKLSTVKIPITAELLEDSRCMRDAMRPLMDDMIESLIHGPRQGPKLSDCVPPELGWENEWYWLTPHDWEEDE